ncbi:MAG: PAS domain S-box protein, partial [Methanoregula sp.]|nr:PAS domain S-box protein [Methanoregula sp.]
STVFLDCNRSTRAIFHCTREQIIGHSPGEFSPERQPDGRLSQEKAKEKIDAALSGEPQFFEWVYTHYDGTPFDAEVSLNRIQLGNAWYIQAVVRDVSARKQAELALKESESRYSALFTNNYSISLLIDPDTGAIVDANDAAIRYYGYARDTLTAMGIYDLNRLPKDRVVSNLKRAKNEREKRFPSTHYLAGGERRSVEIFSGPILVGGKPLFYSVIHDITDRKRVEQALRESKEQYSALFYNNYSISLLIDPDTGAIVDANDAAVRYYGYARDTLTAMGIYDLNRLPVDNVVHDLKQAKNEKEKHFPSTHYLASGKKRSVEVFSGPITVQGKPLFYSIIHDITDRKKAEQALRESETKLNVILQSTPIPQFIIDPRHRVISWNRAMEESCGIMAKDVIGTDQHWRAFYPAARPCIVDILVDGDREKIPLLYAGKYKKSDMVEGAYDITDFFPDQGESGRWLRTVAAPIVDAGGSVIGAVETLVDITGIMLAERSLRESEERYRTLIDQIPDYVIVHRNGILLYVNPAAAAQLGYTLKDLIGQPISLFIAPEHHDAVKKMMIMRMAGEKVRPYEMNIIARDGTLRTLLVNGALIQYMGEPASLNVLTDITTVKAAEETIRKANEALEKRVAERTEALTKTNVQMEEEIAARKRAEQEISRSLAEKELLLREIHHRVKNNLQIIISLLNLQSRHIQDPNVLDAIKDSQNRVRAMALVHERIYRSRNLATINLKDYITYLVNQIFGFYTVARSRIRVTITMEDYPADIDMAIPIGLIMNELVSNSIKHAFPEGKTGEISIECTQPDTDILRFVYRDDGCGIPEGFDWKNSESLGLRLVNSLVDQLDGTIEKGTAGGTMFIITLHRKTI